MNPRQRPMLPHPAHNRAIRLNVNENMVGGL